MGLMDKFLGYMKLGDDEDDGYYDDEYDDYDEAPVEKKPKIKSIQKADSYEEEERPRKALQKVTPMRPAPRRSGVPGMNVQCRRCQRNYRNTAGEPHCRSQYGRA